MKNIAVTASYTPQYLSRMKGNPLIEALPIELSDDDVFASLSLAPDFQLEQRQWSNHHRVQQIKGLGNFMVPLTRHLALARMLDTMMREGYVCRAPRTKARIANLQKLYELQKDGKTFSQTATTVGMQDSASILGPSGMGKSTTVRRWLAQYPRVIFHDSLDITQVTSIHVDISSDGNSVKALAISIITQLDNLLPDHDYHKLYLTNTARTSTESLIHTVGRLLTIHHVGLLVVDEVQNLCNSKKGAQVVMTELVTMCNMLSVPILFVGTNKASKILAADFRQARRSTGLGVTSWSRLPRHDAKTETQFIAMTKEPDSEWADFITTLWSYQWVRTPMSLTPALLDFIYLCTQGVLDLAIKMFAIAQVRAINDGDEELSKQALKYVYETDFKLLHPALEALANDDISALSQFGDIAPLNLDEQLDSLASKRRSQNARRLLSEPTDIEFKERLTVGLMAIGFDSADAQSLANEVSKAGTAKDLVDAMHQIKQITKPGKQSAPVAERQGKSTHAKTERAWPDFSNRPLDYRRAVKAAAEQNTTVFVQLQALELLKNVERLVPLD